MRLFHCTTCGKDTLKGVCYHGPRFRQLNLPFPRPQVAPRKI